MWNVTFMFHIASMKDITLNLNTALEVELCGAQNTTSAMCSTLCAPEEGMCKYPEVKCNAFIRPFPYILRSLATHFNLHLLYSDWKIAQLNRLSFW